MRKGGRSINKKNSVAQSEEGGLENQSVYQAVQVERKAWAVNNIGYTVNNAANNYVNNPVHNVVHNTVNNTVHNTVNKTVNNIVTNCEYCD